MQRIAIIGSGGAGRSTLARRLGERLGIEVIHLDRLYWRPGWVATPREEWLSLRRYLAYRGRARPDLDPGCPEKIDLAFLRWIWRFPQDRRPAILERLDGYRDRKSVIHLCTRRQVEVFLTGLTADT